MLSLGLARAENFYFFFVEKKKKSRKSFLVSQSQAITYQSFLKRCCCCILNEFRFVLVGLCMMHYDYLLLMFVFQRSVHTLSMCVINKVLDRRQIMCPWICVVGCCAASEKFRCRPLLFASAFESSSNDS